jgi:diguanylate cyclase
MSEYQNNFISLYQNFTVELPPTLLLKIMASYHLNAEDVTGDYIFDTQLFEEQIKTCVLNSDDAIHASLLENAINTMSHWPKQLSWLQFNKHLNSLLMSWIDDYKSSASLDSAFVLARCLQLNSPPSKTNPDLSVQLKFQSLLLHLLARTTNQFDQFQYQYSRNFDLETDLPNQHLMLNLLKQRLDTNQHNTAHLGLILINLNINFHEESPLDAVSSKLILAAINTIQRNLNENATLYHMGATELAILVDHLKFPPQLNLIASQLIHAFEFALPLENITLILKPYLGGASTFKVTSNAMSILGCARLALHHAMINNYQMEIYDLLITSPFNNIHQLEEAVIAALQDNELEVYLQPIVCISNNTDVKESCNSAELLLRWNHEDWPTVSPVQLIDIIYKKGFGKIFIRWLINNACQLSAELKTRSGRDISLTINLCAIDLLDADLAELIAQSIKLWRVPAKNFIIEITESDLLIDETKASQVIEEIVSLGCKLALDDFGTGYSSMTRLRNMPIDLVKIDQSFVRHIATSNQDREIVQSIIQLAHSLGKGVVAEGVDDIDTLTILKEMQCQKIQGYYYSKPLPFEAFTRWLHQFQTK